MASIASSPGVEATPPIGDQAQTGVVSQQIDGSPKSPNNSDDNFNPRKEFFNNDNDDDGQEPAAKKAFIKDPAQAQFVSQGSSV